MLLEGLDHRFGSQLMAKGIPVEVVRPVSSRRIYAPALRIPAEFNNRDPSLGSELP
jgi:hypothetical protein